MAGPTQLELPVVRVLADGTYVTVLIAPAIRGRRRERLLAAARVQWRYRRVANC